jgi:hypothetical protein
MLSPFFFRRIDPGICPGLAPGSVSQVLGDGIPGGIPAGHAVVFGEPKSPTPNAPRIRRHTSRPPSAEPPARHAVCLLLRGVVAPLLHRLRLATPPQTAPSAKSPAPPGTACAVQWPARSGAPVRPAPSRHSRRPLCSRRLSRARPIVNRRGPRCARQAARPASTAAQTTAFAHALRRARRVGLPARVRVPLTSRPAAPGAGAPFGRVRMARLSRCPRARPVGAGAALRAVTQDSLHNEPPERTPPPLRYAPEAPLRAVADRSGCNRRVLRPRAGTTPVAPAPCAARDRALPLRLAASSPVRWRGPPPPPRSARLALRARRLRRA